MARSAVLDRIPTRKWEGVRPSFDHAGRFTASVACQCGATDEWSAKSMPQPEVVVAKFKQKGWVFRHRNPTYGDCAYAPRTSNDNTTTDSQQEVEDMAAPEPTATPALSLVQPSDAARRAKRYAIMALEDAYEEGVGYKKGWDDARVAKDSGCSEKQVAELREELFGPAAPPMPPEMAKLAEDIAALRSDVNLFANATKTATEKLQALEDRHADIVKRNGWRTP